MTLDSDDIKAIASEVVRQLRIAEGHKLDAEYLASLPKEERQAIQREKMRRFKEEQGISTGGRKCHRKTVSRQP